MNTNCQVPLKGIVILERSEENSLEEISFKEGFAILFQQTYRPNNPVQLKKTLELLQQLSHSVKIYRMHVNNFKEDAFPTAY
ncbi:MAG: hypothetical protein KBT48_07420, partial [Firmicutes bacterium]|nr:hypothetical protein [Bacillota bacterium]